MGFKWGRDKGQSLSDAEQPVSHTMVWICEKCGSKLRDDNLSRSLQKSFKSIISENSRKREVRAMTSSCMNICPEGKIAATILNLKDGTTRFIEVSLQSDLDGVAREIYSQI